MVREIPFDEPARAEIARRQYLKHEHSLHNPSDTEEEALWIARLEDLKKALDALTPLQRSVYVLMVGYRLSEAEIAEKLKISQQAVSERYRRAEKKLQRFRK